MIKCYNATIELSAINLKKPDLKFIIFLMVCTTLKLMSVANPEPEIQKGGLYWLQREPDLVYYIHVINQYFLGG